MKKGIPYFIVIGIVLALGLLLPRMETGTGTVTTTTITEYDRKADSLLLIQADSIKKMQTTIGWQRDIIRVLEKTSQRTRIEADSIRRMYGEIIREITQIDDDSLLQVFNKYTEVSQQAKTGIHSRDPTDSLLIPTQRIETSVQIFYQYDSLSAENSSLQSDTLNKLMKIQAYEKIDSSQLSIIRSLEQTTTIKDGQITERDKALIKERRKTKLIGILAILVLIADAIW